MSTIKLVGMCLGIVASSGLIAGETERGTLVQMSLEEILNVKVVVASRTETTVMDAPSIVSVITAEEIRRMGGRDLRDVLRSVPGFELGIRGTLGYPEIGLRGIITDNTEKIRILLDGLPVNENLEGSGTIVFGDLALDNVERIEIIRGPGSALYGTNAFVGVISIITKAPPASGASTTLVARRGSFNTSEGSLLTGWSGPKLRASAYLHYLDTDGPKSPVERDALQGLGAPPWFSDLNSGISLAGTPAGHTDEFRRKLTAQVKLDYGAFYFNGNYVDTRKGPFIGALFAVNAHSEAHPMQAQGELGARFRPTDGLVVEPKAYFLYYKVDNLWNAAPDGYRAYVNPGDPSQGTVDFTKGRFDRNGGTQSTRGAEMKATWSSLPLHKVVLGASYEEAKLYRVVNDTNLPGFGAERMVDAGAIMRQNPERTLTSAYLQDQWNPLPILDVTAGLRMDRYNDAGTSVNPRLAIVCRPITPLYVKALFGEAFRAPTFVDSYLFAYGGFATGREENKPETIRTLELEAGCRFGNLAFARVSLFRNRITDLIRLEPLPTGYLQYRNTPDVTVVKGVEAELKLTLHETFSAFLNYSSQSGGNERTGEHLVGMANWRGNAGVNWAPAEAFNLNLACTFVGVRERLHHQDSRQELPGYRVVDLAMTYQVLNRLELQFTAHNLLNADQRFPDISGNVPGDFPWEGRNLQLGIRWKF